MSKAKRIKELTAKIKEAGNLDAVTCINTKSQHKRANLPYDENTVHFKMRYRMAEGEDIVSICPISWLVIDAGEDDLIVKTCGEMMMGTPEVKRTLSRMAMNAQKRAENV